MASKILMYLGLFLAFTFTGSVHAQQVSYKASDEQSIKLRLKSLDMQKDQIMFSQAAAKLAEYTAFQKSNKEYMDMIEQVKKDNKWPATVQFQGVDQQSGTVVFVDTAPPAEKKAEPKK